MEVSVLGLGFVGKAMYDVFLEKGIEVKGYDINESISKNTFEEAIKSDVLFLALPTPFNSEKSSYDTSSIEETCKKLKTISYSGIIVLKSTLTPCSVADLEKKFPNLQFIHNPEFLTARTAKEDFRDQIHIVLGKGNNCTNANLEKIESFYKECFPNAEISLCTAKESESMKIFVNTFYALKVQFFTEIYLTCKKSGSDFEKIVSMMVKNGWINPMHTKVPGPDGKISYGGYCFPKDTNALNEFMKSNEIPHALIEACINERNSMREDNDNVY